MDLPDATIKKPCDKVPPRHPSPFLWPSVKELGQLLWIWLGRDLTHGVAWPAQLDLMEKEIKTIMKEVALGPEQGTRALCNDGIGLHACVYYVATNHMWLLNTWHNG